MCQSKFRGQWCQRRHSNQEGPKELLPVDPYSRECRCELLKEQSQGNGIDDRTIGW